MSAQRCACGHARDGHFYGKRTRTWLGCLRTKRRELCGCQRYAPAVAS